MFSGLLLQRFPVRTGASLRRQDALHGRKSESPVAARSLQGFHQVLAAVGAEKAENPEGFVQGQPELDISDLDKPEDDA